MEERCVLGYNADRLPQAFELDLGDVLAIYEDPTKGWIVEPEEEPEDRRFATP